MRVQIWVKGLVPPKLKISPCFTLPQSILDVYYFLLSDESNRNYIKNCACSSKLYNGMGGCFFQQSKRSQELFIMDGCTLFDYFWTVEEKKPPAYSHSRAWKSKKVERRKSYTSRILWGWVKHGLIIIFGWTNPLIAEFFFVYCYII